MKSLLVVCEGNICRSPMAEGLLAMALPHVQVQSAGLSALIGMPADAQAVGLMRERGIDISAHRARQITRNLCVHSDLVLVMEGSQRTRLIASYPEISGRVFRIDEEAGQDVPDPYRRSLGAFHQALALIEGGVQRWVQRIHKLTEP